MRTLKNPEKTLDFHVRMSYHVGMKRLISVFKGVFKREPKTKTYVAYLVDIDGGSHEVTVQAQSRYYADIQAKVFERDGTHVVSVVPYEEHIERGSLWLVN